MATDDLGRVLTAMITPFNEDRSLDLPGAVELARWLTREGWNDGLVVNGTTGESATTSDAEKNALVEAIVEGLGGSAKVVAGVGSGDTKHSIELARAAEAAGADALLVVTPYYLRPTQTGVLRHFEAIADSTSLPVMLYDIPKRTGTAIEPATLKAVAKHDRIVAVKDAKGDLESSAWVMRDTSLTYYSGEDALNLPLLSIGARGFVSVIGHVAADLLREMLDAFEAGDTTRALELHRRLLPVARGIFRTPGAASAKAALAARGLPAGPMRAPLVDLTEGERRTLAEDLAMADIPSTVVG